MPNDEKGPTPSTSTEGAKARVRERDIICSNCRAVIDRETRPVDYLNDGLITSMLASDAIYIHRQETGCTSVAWETSEWGPEIERRT